jgi:hypothetical protein
MIPASEGPIEPGCTANYPTPLDVSDHIVDAQGQIVHGFERFRELLPECNAALA